MSLGMVLYGLTKLRVKVLLKQCLETQETGCGMWKQGWLWRLMPRPTPLSCLWCGSIWSDLMRGKA